MKLTLFMILTCFLYSNNLGKQIYDKKCSSCHKGFIPLSKLKHNFIDTNNTLLHLKAPTLNQLSYRLKKSIGDPQGDKEMHLMEISSFVFDYIITPDKSKSLCLPEIITFFDTMPSLKGKITEEEVDEVIEYIYDFNANIISQKSQKYSGNLKKALKQAEKENKIIIIEAMSEHCHFCKKMELEVMIDDKITSLLKKDFIFLQVDVSKERLPLGFKSLMTPSFFFVNSNAKLLLEMKGAWGIKDFIEILEEAKLKNKEKK